MGGVDPIKKAFSPIYGKPSWQVQQGYGSFITMEFGEPRLEIDGPNDRPFVFSARDRPRIPQRLATVTGDWHLWIFCCDWVLRWQDRRLAHNESSDKKMAHAFRLLNGQALVDVEVSPRGGRSLFRFDLGCALRTKPSRSGDTDFEQWYLREPSGWWWSVRADGTYSHCRGSAAPDSVIWRPLPNGGG
jgi:hypothetical protein